MDHILVHKGYKMPGIVRKGDIGSGHGSFPPTNATGCSGNATVNGRGIHRLGDALVPHGSPSPSPVHSRAAGSASSDSVVNGKGIVRLGDAVNCGGNYITASGNSMCN